MADTVVYHVTQFPSFTNRRDDYKLTNVIIKMTLLIQFTTNGCLLHHLSWSLGRTDHGSCILPYMSMIYHIVTTDIIMAQSIHHKQTSNKTVTTSLCTNKNLRKYLKYFTFDHRFAKCSSQYIYSFWEPWSLIMHTTQWSILSTSIQAFFDVYLCLLVKSIWLRINQVTSLLSKYIHHITMLHY